MLHDVKVRVPTENQEQIKLATWLDSLGVLWCHVANERRTSQRQGAILKKKGVKPGVPDVLIFEVPGHACNGVAIELKRSDGKGKVTKAQKQWIEDLSSAGWVCFICTGADDAIDLLKTYGYRKGFKDGV